MSLTPIYRTTTKNTALIVVTVSSWKLGVAIYIKSDYSSKQFHITTHFEVVAASVIFNNLVLNICNNYIPKQHIFNTNDIENIY